MCSMSRAFFGCNESADGGYKFKISLAGQGDFESTVEALTNVSYTVVGKFNVLSGETALWIDPDLSQGESANTADVTASQGGGR